jgi:protein-S-isoprenylcysteine O-methyltransferase Ste14
MALGRIIGILWLSFAASWLTAAIWSDRAERRAGLKAELSYRIVLAIGAVPFVITAHGYRGWMRLWYIEPALAWVCIGLIVAGFAIAWWARIYLGRLWSGTVTRKADHRLIDTGPYAFVRHPIYTGLLLAIYATAAVKGTLLGLLGAAVMTLGIWMKARLEERFLRDNLGAELYEDYRRRVPMLVPLT